MDSYGFLWIPLCGVLCMYLKARHKLVANAQASSADWHVQESRRRVWVRRQMLPWLLWIPMDSYEFLRIPKDSYGFLWIPMEFP